ncbi:hypothetical protein HDU84_006435 [Entophlyctis sp. JEL0112]|nr:hypothetical protein HDU84_006435 [Entophlyctis sp. JEL0112]
MQHRSHQPHTTTTTTTTVTTTYHHPAAHQQQQQLPHEYQHQHQYQQQPHQYQQQHQQQHQQQQHQQPHWQQPQSQHQLSDQRAPLPPPQAAYIPAAGTGTSGSRKAVLVGINYAGKKYALKGCINDANNIRNVLVQKYGYSADARSMIVMTDDSRDPRVRPTTKNILAALHWLVAGARAGDHLFFSYSGHGSQVKDTTGDRANGLDDTICPEDFEQNGQIDSDVLHKILVSSVPSGVKLTVLMDCCHSGTMLELPYTYRPDANGAMTPFDAVKTGVLLFSEFRDLFHGGFTTTKIQKAQGLFTELKSLAAAIANTGTGGGESGGYTHEHFELAAHDGPKTVYLISGCLDNQTSADATMNGRASGALTYAFLSVVGREGAGLTYEGLLLRLRAFMREDKFTQIPQLSCGVPVDPHSPFSV